MFESLTRKLTGILKRLSRKGSLTEKDVDRMITQPRLEADADYQTSRRAVDQAKEHAQVDWVNRLPLV